MDASLALGGHASRALDVDLFEKLTEEKLGATNDSARARALGINRTTIRRLRARLHEPSMPLATRVARQLDTPLERLFPVVTP